MEALTLATSLGSRLCESGALREEEGAARALCLMGTAYWLRGEPAIAEAAFGQAARLAVSALERGLFCRALALLRWDQGRSEEGDRFRRQLALAAAEEERTGPTEFFVQAEYLLPVEPGLRVTLPEEARWVLGLADGERLVAEPRLADVRFAAFAASLPGSPGTRLAVDLEPGGILALPDSLRVETVLRPQAQVRLVVTVSPRPSFRITQWVE